MKELHIPDVTWSSQMLSMRDMVKSQSMEQLVLNHCGHSLVPVTRSDLSAGHQH